MPTQVELSAAEIEGLKGMFGNPPEGYVAPTVPTDPIKSHGRGVANVIKYGVIALLVFGVGVAMYTLSQ